MKKTNSGNKSPEIAISKNLHDDNEDLPVLLFDPIKEPAKNDFESPTRREKRHSTTGEKSPRRKRNTITAGVKILEKDKKEIQEDRKKVMADLDNYLDIRQVILNIKAVDLLIYLLLDYPQRVLF